MSKPCPWCGAVVADGTRICPKCRSAQPTTSPDPAPGQLVPPVLGGTGPTGYAGPPPPGYDGPPPPGYGPPPPGYGPPPGAAPGSSSAARTAIIAVGVGVGALALVAIVCIVAITFLGRSASSKFVAADPIETSSGSGRDYPAQVRSNFLSSCTVSAPAAACSCALERIEQAYTFDDFIDAEQEYRRTGVLPADMTDAMTACMQGD